MNSSDDALLTSAIVDFMSAGSSLDRVGTKRGKKKSGLRFVSQADDGMGAITKILARSFSRPKKRESDEDDSDTDAVENSTDDSETEIIEDVGLEIDSFCRPSIVVQQSLFLSSTGCSSDEDGPPTPALEPRPAAIRDDLRKFTRHEATSGKQSESSSTAAADDHQVISSIFKPFSIADMVVTKRAADVFPPLPSNSPVSVSGPVGHLEPASSNRIFKPFVAEAGPTNEPSSSVYTFVDRSDRSLKSADVSVDCPVRMASLNIDFNSSLREQQPSRGLKGRKTSFITRLSRDSSTRSLKSAISRDSQGSCHLSLDSEEVLAPLAVTNDDVREPRSRKNVRAMFSRRTAI
mmetsp:Transcript_7771/g.15680  ORF Transcript_7771/g.15680 Transcript_7771/m.15680 type:complete len:349 (+) Transcript_7771:2037-3083(+)